MSKKRIPFFGKSGTSRISFFRCSQLPLALVITMLLQCEMCSNREPVSPRIPRHHPRVLPAGLVAIAIEDQVTDRAFPWPGLLRFRRDCCEPSRQSLTCGLRVLRTSEIRHLAHGREQQNVELALMLPLKSEVRSQNAEVRAKIQIVDFRLQIDSRS